MPPKHPIVWGPRKLRWYLNGYPPLFWHRAQLRAVDPAMRWAKVRLKRSLMNRNLNGSAFGGAIYSAADPWFPILYWQALAREGIAVQAWLKAGAIDYRKPARTHLHYEFRISEDDLAMARARLPEKGYSVHTNQVDAIDADGDVCAAIECVSYLRLLQPQEAGSAGF